MNPPNTILKNNFNNQLVNGGGVTSVGDPRFLQQLQNAVLQIPSESLAPLVIHLANTLTKNQSKNLQALNHHSSGSLEGLGILRQLTETNGQNILSSHNFGPIVNDYSQVDQPTTRNLKPNNQRRKRRCRYHLTAKGAQRKFCQHQYIDRSSEKDSHKGTEESFLSKYELFPKSNSSSIVITNNPLQDKVHYKLVPAFPLKLYMILSDIQKHGLVDAMSWQTHGRSFLIHDIEAFASIIIPRYFGQSKTASFNRQLNLYGFKRITHGPDKKAYYHECFLRGKPSLTLRICRIAIKGNKIRATCNPDEEPDFYSMPFLPLNGEKPVASFHEIHSESVSGALSLSPKPKELFSRLQPKPQKFSNMGKHGRLMLEDSSSSPHNGSIITLDTSNGSSKVVCAPTKVKGVAADDKDKSIQFMREDSSAQYTDPVLDNIADFLPVLNAVNPETSNQDETKDELAALIKYFDDDMKNGLFHDDIDDLTKYI